MTKKIQERLIRAFDLRNTPTNTRVTYLRCIEKFEKHCGKSASRLGRQHVEDFLLHLVRERQLSPATHNVHVSALRFMLRVLGRPELETRWATAISRPRSAARPDSSGSQQGAQAGTQPLQAQGAHHSAHDASLCTLPDYVLWFSSSLICRANS